MVDVEEVQGYSDKFEGQLQKLETADIAEADRDAIRSFVRALDGSDDVQTATAVGHLNRIRLAAERAKTPLTEMDEDVDEFNFALKHEYDLSEGTRRNYRKALLKFFEHQEVEWWDDITIGVAPDRPVDPNQLLSMEEIEDLIDAARHTRDKALLALIADTGLRISAVVSLRKRDFTQRDGGAVVTPNPNGPVKGATDPVPLTWSAGYVANWLDVHPRDDSNSALFHKLEHVEEGEDGALTYQYAARRIKRIADDAGIERERVKTHNFRKSAISRWIREGLPEQVIKHRAAWVKDSSQFEIYSGVTSEELNDQVFEHYGIEVSEESRPELERCPQCRTSLTDSAAFCPGCGAALSAGAREAMEGARSDTMDTVAKATADGAEADVSVGRQIDEALLAYPEAREALRDALTE